MWYSFVQTMSTRCKPNHHTGDMIFIFVPQIWAWPNLCSTRYVNVVILCLSMHVYWRSDTSSCDVRHHNVHIWYTLCVHICDLLLGCRFNFWYIQVPAYTALLLSLWRHYLVYKLFDQNHDKEQSIRVLVLDVRKQ